MKISKSLFKNLTRCNSFYPLYNAYINKTNNNINVNNFTKEELTTYLNEIDLNLESNNEKALELISEMFDNPKELLKTENIQLSTFLDVFNEIELLAKNQLEKTYQGTFIANKDTFKQKKFTKIINEHEYYCYIDIYNEDEEKIRIFEVKSTTDLKFKKMAVTVDKIKHYLFNFNKEKNTLTLNNITSPKLTKKYQELFNPYSDTGKYIYDIAIQKYITENLTKKQIEYYLVVLNSDYVFEGTYQNNLPVYEKDEQGNSLFTIIDVNKIVEEYRPKIDQIRKNLEKVIKDNKIDKITLAPHCDLNKTNECPFKEICYKKALKEYSILETPQKAYAFNDYKGIKKPTIYDLLNNGIYMFVDAYPYTSKKNYQIIYDSITKDIEHIDLYRIKEGLKQIKYPIYHLDFESMNNPLPRFKKEKAYSQSVFQYSLHIEKEKGICDIVKDHTEFLAKDHNDQREELIKQLIKDIDLTNGGTVLVYNESFEKTRLKELSIIFPKYKAELMNIHDHIIDLLQIIKGVNSFYEKIMTLSEEQKETYAFYNKNLHGSFSIKKVLPVFTNLSYKDLEVKNGTEAVYVYSNYKKYSKEKLEEAYNNLLIYCRQDTWSMVEILRGLNKMIGEKI